MTMEYRSKYKYIGETLNEKANLDTHILEIKGKVEAAYQAILAIAGIKQAIQKHTNGSNMDHGGSMYNPHNHLCRRNQKPNKKGKKNRTKPNPG